MVCRPGLRSCAHRYRPMKDLLVPARTIRTDTSEKRREILRCRFGGFGWCQRLKQGVDVLDVVLDPESCHRSASGGGLPRDTRDDRGPRLEQGPCDRCERWVALRA